MQDLIKEFLEQKKYTIIGSFKNDSKYAYKILKELKRRGKKVYPVNPRISEVEGLKCYKSIITKPKKLD